MRSARVQVNPSQSTVRLRLDPPELGWIRVEARVEGSAVHLSVQTENATAGELLRGRLAQLETALERHGLHIERFELVARGADGRADPAGERHFGSGGDDHPPPDPDESAPEREDQRPATPTASGLAAPDPEGPGRTEAAADEIASAAPAGSATRLDVRV